MLITYPTTFILLLLFGGSNNKTIHAKSCHLLQMVMLLPAHSPRGCSTCCVNIGDPALECGGFLAVLAKRPQVKKKKKKNPKNVEEMCLSQTDYCYLF